MKNLILAAFISLFSFAEQAQQATSDLNQEASDIARRMANQIELNELEYIQIRNYTLEKLEKVAYLTSMYQTNPEMLTAKVTETETDYTYRVQNLLNARQFENYLALSNSFKAPLSLIATAE